MQTFYIYVYLCIALKWIIMFVRRISENLDSSLNGTYSQVVSNCPLVYGASFYASLYLSRSPCIPSSYFLLPSSPSSVSVVSIRPLACTASDPGYP